jgi:hypothetical protein
LRPWSPPFLPCLTLYAALQHGRASACRRCCPLTPWLASNCGPHWTHRLLPPLPSLPCLFPWPSSHHSVAHTCSHVLLLLLVSSVLPPSHADFLGLAQDCFMQPTAPASLPCHLPSLLSPATPRIRRPRPPAQVLLRRRSPALFSSDPRMWPPQPSSRSRCHAHPSCRFPRQRRVRAGLSHLPQPSCATCPSFPGNPGHAEDAPTLVMGPGPRLLYRGYTAHTPPQPRCSATHHPTCPHWPLCTQRTALASLHRFPSLQVPSDALSG